MKILKNIIIFTLIISLFGCTNFELFQNSKEPQSSAPPLAPLATAPNELNIAIPTHLEPIFAQLAQLYFEETAVKTELIAIDTNGYIVGAKQEAQNGVGLIVAPDPYIAKALENEVIDYNTSSGMLFSALVLNFEKVLLQKGFLPSGIDAYCYVVNTGLLADILAVSDKTQLVKDLSTADYKQFTALCESIYRLTNNTLRASDKTITLSQNEYQLPAKPAQSVQEIAAPFVLALQDETALLQLASGSINIASTSEEETLSNYNAFVSALEFESAMLVSKEGEVTRGAAYAADSDITVQDASVLLDGKKAVFYRQYVSLFAENTLEQTALNDYSLIPVKLPLQSPAAAELAAQKQNGSISLTSPFYFGMNAKAPPIMASAAQDFLLWLYTSKAGNDFITKDLRLLNPASLTPLYPLDAEVVRYISGGDVVPFGYLATKPELRAELSHKISSEYMTKAEWSKDFRLALATECAELSK